MNPVADIPPILNDEEHRVYTVELLQLMETYGDVDPDTDVGRRIIDLATIIENYERKRWPI